MCIFASDFALIVWHCGYASLWGLTTDGIAKAGRDTEA